MAARKNINAAWSFTKDAVSVAEGSSVLAQGNWEVLDLPHTWNGTDGQDGGNDYYRGTCYYAKKMKIPNLGISTVVDFYNSGLITSITDLYKMKDKYSQLIQLNGYDEVSIHEVIEKNLQVVDMTASILARDNKMPMWVFGLNEKDSIVNTVKGNFTGTKVTV